MNKIWQARLENSRLKRQKRRRNNVFLKFVKKLFLCLFAAILFFPRPFQRILYPLMWGEKYDRTLTISEQDYYNDINQPDFTIIRNGLKYHISPQTAYNVTGKIAYVDHYDTFWNNFYRGKNQKEYINLVPQDLIIVIGNMAKPEIFSLFEFEHEERLGKIKCKDVLYRESFASGFTHKSEAQIAKSQKAYEKCAPHINNAEYNNYHPIPANERINKALKMLAAGDIVHIEGILVNVIMPNGSILDTGTRKDQYHRMYVNGNQPGKCFILYTTKIITNGYIYK